MSAHYCSLGCNGWTDADAPLVPQMRGLGVDLDQYVHGAFPKARIVRRAAAGVDPRCPQHGGVVREGACSCGQRSGPRWNVYGFYDYSWFMVQPRFLDAIDLLVRRGRGERHVAIMCAEVLWWSCHRAMIADCLGWLGQPAWHMQPKAQAHSAPERWERYEPEILQTWEQRWGPPRPPGGPGSGGGGDARSGGPGGSTPPWNDPGAEEGAQHA